MKLNFSSVFSLYEIGAQVTATGPEPDPPVWKIYDAIDRQNGKVREEFIFVLCPNCFAVNCQNYTEKEMQCKY